MMTVARRDPDDKAKIDAIEQKLGDDAPILCQALLRNFS